MLVEVKPVEFKKWHGKKGKESFAQPLTLEVLYDPNKGAYATGLEPEEAERLGRELGLDLSDRFNPNQEHPFWSTKASWINLPNHTIIFNTEKPLEYIKVKNLKASKFVANSVKELDEGLWPEALFVIYDESEETDRKASKVQLQEKATIIASKMTSDDKIAVIQILAEKSARGRSNNFLDVEIHDLITNKTEQFIRLAEMGKEEVYIRANVLELLARHILTKEGNSIYYMSELLGNSYEEAVQWFKGPDNQKMKVVILEKLQQK